MNYCVTTGVSCCWPDNADEKNSCTSVPLIRVINHHDGKFRPLDVSRNLILPFSSICLRDF